MVENRGYFESNRHLLTVEYDDVLDDSQAGILREAQAGAYWAVRAHFTARNDPALVVMPTGSGKTALMTLVALGIGKRRVLIIAPNRFIISQIAEEFETLSLGRATRCVPEDLASPQVHIVEHRLATLEDWQSLSSFDVIISTVECASPGHSDVFDQPPEDLFDVLFLDEAHHWPAKTWDDLTKAFPHIRIVGFTATPYRNDKRPVPGDIVYSYPLAKAIERGIYRPIDFMPVEALGDADAQDRQLAERAVAVWRKENVARLARGVQADEGLLDADPVQPAKLLIRVDRTEDTGPIRELYMEFGLDLRVVSSKQSKEDNYAAVQAAREDPACHGLITVGMLGEGLDLPYLQIAVLHRPYQSFPITLQFLGRVCRMSGQYRRSAKLLAVPQQVEQHTRALYDSDAAWSKLIAEIADAAVAQERERRHFAGETWHSGGPDRRVSVHTLRPSFAVTAYRVNPEHVHLGWDPKLPSGTRLVESFRSDDGNWRVLITGRETRPTWTTSDAIVDSINELTIYYLAGDMLFESTTSAKTVSYIRRSLVEDPVSFIAKERVEQVVSQGSIDAYYTLGMRRTACLSSNVPSYKMMTGKSAQNAVRQGDGQYFTVGHLFGQVEVGGQTMALGVSGGRARIWASARDHLHQFTIWCDSLAERLSNEIFVPLRYLEHLRSPILVERLSSRPYAVELGDEFFRHLSDGLTVRLVDEDGNPSVYNALEAIDLVLPDKSWEAELPHILQIEFSLSNVVISVTSDLQDDLVSCELPEPYVECWVEVPESGRPRNCTLDEYLTEYPPIVYLDDGSTLVGNHWYQYTPQGYDLPPDAFTVVDWEALDCDITAEDRELLKEEHLRLLEESGQITVLEATRVVALDLFPENSVVFVDHHAGEIADLVAIVPEGDDSIRVHLLHCKASGESKPGARQGDAYEVLGQARKCLRWLRNADLFAMMGERIFEENLVIGTYAAFEALTHRCSPQNARYTVHVIQPGFLMEKILNRNDESIRLMMLSLYDQLHGDDIELRILCS